MTAPVRLNLGCGAITPKGWINVDYALGAWLFKLPFFTAINKRLKLFNLNWDRRIVLQDLRKKLRWQRNSVDVIYSSHTLEHLSKEEGAHFLKECYRVLKPDGIARVVVPNLAALVSEYVEGRLPGEDFVDQLGCRFGDGKVSRFVSFPHKCMYDAEALLRVMTGAGFVCRVAAPFESEVPGIQGIEAASGRAAKSVIVEGKKPGDAV